MNAIATHKMSETFQGEIAFLRYVSEKEQAPPIKYAHRDDYYIFLFIETGRSRLLIDFEEYELTGAAVRCILPGQVHFPIAYMNGRGWILAADPMLVKPEYKEIFEKFSLFESRNELAESLFLDLKYCVSAIHARLRPEGRPLDKIIVHDLILYYIGLMAEACLKGLPAAANKRRAAITFQFKSLLSVNYQSLKYPSQYAAKLNLSPAYLNEAVKKTTGLTVGDCIQNEIILQAKRLLFYTNLSIKEIALQLGYEDWAYFTRLFSKAVKLSPGQFRKKYLNEKNSYGIYLDKPPPVLRRLGLPQGLPKSSAWEGGVFMA
ncbi:MAG: helix-turn-helix transcriptional regulator [Candidatus Adiutrix sp.]|jgi:AraC-like DNA-binding protein|nr:helix-turn-helix transcriptional regulator [Candidatus Adiutrix sp.]